MPSVVNLSKAPVSNKVINPAEKPVQLAMKFMKAYCTTGETVLVIGSGSGSEIIAGLECKLKVIAVEMDLEQ